MPNATDNVVASALNDVLTDNKADSQSADKTGSEVADALKDVIGDKGASDDGSDEKSTNANDKEQKTVPYERLSQVVKQKNEISERFKNLEEQFKSAGEREKELRTRIGSLEQDHQIVEAIKGLAQDEKFRPHVQAIDRALQGIDEEIEDAKKEGDKKAESEAVKKFEQKTAELESLLADQNAERLWEEAYDYAKQTLTTLPAEYTDEDRSVIGKLWTPRVDWDRIEAEGRESIPDALNRSLAVVIREYGTPRGAIAAKTTKEMEAKVPESRFVSNDDFVKGLLEKDWSKSDKDGKLEHSDQDFAKGMADLLRRSHVVS